MVQWAEFGCDNNRGNPGKDGSVGYAGFIIIYSLIICWFSGLQK